MLARLVLMSVTVWLGLVAQDQVAQYQARVTAQMPDQTCVALPEPNQYVQYILGHKIELASSELGVASSHSECFTLSHGT